MNKRQGNTLVIVGIIILVVALGIGAFFFFRSPKKSTNNPNTPVKTSDVNRSQPLTLTDTCTIFTKADAATVLGTDAIKKNDTVSTSITAADYKQSDCVYATLDTSDAGYKAVSVSIRQYTTLHGAQLYHESGKSISPDAQTIANLGEAAYWTNKFDQIHILKDRSEIIILAGKPKSGSSDKALEAAQILLKKY